VQVIDSGQVIARRTRLILQTQDMFASATLLGSGGGKLEIWCSGDPVAFSSVATIILDLPLHVRQTETVISKPKLP